MSFLISFRRPDGRSSSPSIIADGNYNNCLEQADVLLTTDELPGNQVKQFFTPKVMATGEKGCARYGT